MLQIRKVSQKRKITNYIECCKKPFTTKQVEADTGVPSTSVLREMKVLLANGKIKEIGKDGNFRIFATTHYWEKKNMETQVIWNMF